jgi:hypothetical protein
MTNNSDDFQLFILYPMNHITQQKDVGNAQHPMGVGERILPRQVNVGHLLH